MPDYWLDANVFIEAKNGPYGFDIAPGFWRILDEKTQTGQISSSRMVYDELVGGKEDALAEWARSRRSELFAEPDEDVQAEFVRVADHVDTHYDRSEAAAFLDGADPWIIAHAIAHGGVVVTSETRAGPEAKKPKIPNVCDVFHVKPVHYYDMLRELGARFG